MGRFTLEQRWEILKSYFQSECCVAATVRTLKRSFGQDEAPSAAGVRKFIKKVRETGMLMDNKNYPRTRAVCTDEIIAAVAQSVRVNPTISTRSRAKLLNISRSSMRRILQNELGYIKPPLKKSGSSPYSIEDPEEDDNVIDDSCVLKASLCVIEPSHVFGTKQEEPKSVKKLI